MPARTFDIIIRGDAKSAVAAFAATQSAALKTNPIVSGALAKLNTSAGRTFAGIGGAAAVAAGVLFKLGGDFQRATNIIRSGTGSTGEALEGFERSFERVFANVPASMDDTATAIADLSSILHITGEPLETLATQFLEISRMTGDDLRTNIDAASRAFNDFGVKAKDMPATLDKLWRASQASGIEIAELTELIEKFGTPLRMLGFDIDDTIATLAEFHRQGVNIENVMPGLRLGLKRFAAAGRDPAAALQATFEAMKNAGSQAEVTSIAFETFGLRAGADLAGAVNEGRFEIDEMLQVIRNGNDTVLEAAEDTKTMGDRWQEFGNRMMLKVKPAADVLYDALSDLLGFLARPGVSDAIMTVAGAFTAMLVVQRVIPLIARFKTSLKGIGAVGVIVGLMAIGDELIRIFNSVDEADIGQLERDLTRLGNTGRLQGEALNVLGDSFSDLKDDFDRITDPGNVTKLGDLAHGIFTLGDSRGDLDQARQTFKDLDTAMSDMFANEPDMALDALREVIDGMGVSSGDLLKLMPETAGAIDQLKLQAEDAGFPVKNLADLERFLAQSGEEAAAAEEMAAEEARLLQEEIGKLINEMGVAGPAIQVIASEAQGLGYEMEAIEGFVTEARDAIVGFSEDATSHFQTAGEIAAGMGEEFSLSGFRDELKKTLEEMNNFVPNIEQLLNEGFPHLAQVAAEGGPLVAAALAEPFETGNTDALAELEMLAGGVDQTLGAMPDDITGLGLGIMLATGNIGALSSDAFGSDFKLSEEAQQELMNLMARIQEGEEPLGEAGGGLGSSIRDGMAKRVAGLPNDAMHRVQIMLNRLFDSEKDAQASGEGVGASVRGGVSGGMSGTSDDASGLMDLTIGKIRGYGGVAIGSGGLVGGNVRGGFGSGLFPVTGDATARMGMTLQRIDGYGPLARVSGSGIGGSVRSGVSAGMAGATEDSAARMGMTLQRIFGFGPTARATGSGIGGSVRGGVSAGMAGATEDSAARMGMTLQRIDGYGPLARVSGSGIGGSVRGGVSAGMAGATEDSAARMGMTLQRIGTFAPPARLSGSGIGGSVREGFEEGMKPKEDFKNWFTVNVREPVLKTWRESFEIKSPSHVMMPIGQAVMRGFLVGMTSERSTLERFLSAFPDLFAATFGRIGSTFVSAGSGVKRWSSIAAAALRYTGQSLRWLPDLLTQMAHESGGNPAAINLTDINAQRGTPSQGLMQTIPSTFNAYARELAGRGILDPFANIVAAIRYTIARYGTLGAWRARGFKGYATGGVVGAGGGFVHPGEMVLTHANQLRLLKMIGTGGGGAMIVHVHPGAVVVGIPAGATEDQARRYTTVAGKAFLDTIAQRRVLTDARVR